MGQALVLAGQTITPAVLNRIYGMADTVAHTVNNTSYAQLSSSYSIPAGDAQPGTAYQLCTFGNGTWGTAEAITFTTALAGTQIGTAPQVAGAVFSNAAAFDFEIWVRLVCASNGSSGTWMSSIKGTLTQSANAITPGTAADNTVSFAGTTHTSVTQDTTIADALVIQAKWAGTTGSPTLACAGTIFQKTN